MIRVLDQHTIDKIAAGEVIERPASIVKELVENSIDAHATRITVEYTDGGTSMIRVTDNGSGIEESDVRKAYLSHATSKLDNADDLLSIVSLGFRGEALSTIAAVSQVEMITKTHESMNGIKYVIHGGKEVEYKEIGAPDGTTIISRNIFFNTPARLKFLKTNMTEGSYINDLMSHIALANPDVAIKVISNGKVIIDTNGDGRLKETIYSLYGMDIAKSLLEVEYASQDIKVTGYIGKPFLSKGNRSFENYFLNKRYIKSPVVNRAIEEAYKTHIMQHKFPFTALFIEVPYYMIDVNVHPAKREFRFDDEKQLFSAIYHSVADALSKKEMIPDADTDYGNKQKVYTPVKNVETSVINETPKGVSYSAPEKEVSSLKEEKTFNNPVSDIKTAHKNTTDSFTILESILPKEYRDKLNIQSSDSENTSESVRENVSEPVKDTYITPVQQPVQTEMKQEYLSEAAKPDHKIIGLVFDTYWITEYDGSLYIMDQHAAHEKVNYETFLAEFKNRQILSQNIFPPEVIALSSREKLAVMENLDYFEKTGFVVEDFGGNDVKISAVPANLLNLNSRDVFMEMASYLTDGVSGLTEDIFVTKLATMGCKAAVKGNQKITVEEVKTLMDRLMALKDPYTCPHGRPTIVKMTKEELDKKFKRIVD